MASVPRAGQRRRQNVFSIFVPLLSVHTVTHCYAKFRRRLQEIGSQGFRAAFNTTWTTEPPRSRFTRHRATIL